MSDIIRGPQGAVKNRDAARAAILYSKRSDYAYNVCQYNDTDERHIYNYLKKAAPECIYKTLPDMFIQVAGAYGISPVFVLAVAEHESNKGKSSAATNKNNLYGIQPHGEDGPLSKFNSLDECVDSFCGLIYNSYIIKYHQSTVIDIADHPENPEGHSYCGEHHDSVSRLDWIEGVTRFISKILAA